MLLSPFVATGHIIALRLFDLAYAIDLARAETLWTRHAAGPARRARLAVTPPKAMAFGVPPLTIELDPIVLDVAGAQTPAQVTARLYDLAPSRWRSGLPQTGWIGTPSAPG